MPRGLTHLASSLVLFSAAALFCAMSIAAQQPAEIELVLPHTAASDKAVWLQIQAGLLPRGAEVLVTTADGAVLGTVSPFGGPRGRAAGAYTIPLPKSAIIDGRVRIRLAVQVPGATARQPHLSEVLSVDLVYVPISR